MTETEPITLRSGAKPLLVSTDDASFICGVSPERFRSVAETIGIRPVLQAGNGRAKWSLPEIIERLKNWTTWDDNRRRASDPCRRRCRRDEARQTTF